MNIIGPDGRVTWNTERDDMSSMWDKASEADLTALQEAAFDAADTTVYSTEASINLRPEVVAALVIKAKKHDELKQEVDELKQEVEELRRYQKARIQDDKYQPIIVTGTSDQVEAVTTGRLRKGRAENADPFYLRAKAALDEIVTFARIEVDHETDIITTSSDGGKDVALYRSGINEITLTIRGYTR